MNNISAFEYVSILVSIILGLGITQILSTFSDVLYHYKKVKFYWPHTLWILFILFLHIQDWFVTYQLKDKTIWSLPELVFVLLYPISLFLVAKMLIPNNQNEEQTNMKSFYKSQFPIIFYLLSISVLLSILFNIFLLKNNWTEQLIFFFFMVVLLSIAIKNIQPDFVHKIFALIVTISAILSIILEKNVWVIK